MRPAVSVLVLGLALAPAACGSSRAPAPAARAVAAALESPRAGADDVVVAEVGGRPVWGSCVATQARRHRLDRAAALAQCVDFELLAQAAEARGLAGDPEVAEATRAALVNRVVELGFEARHRTPADLPDAIEAVYQQRKAYTAIPELRASAYARFEVPAGAAPEVERDARARAERLAAELAGEPGLSYPHLSAAAERVAAEGGPKLAHAAHPPSAIEGLDRAYARALFGITDVGRVSPAVRTPWGWDVVLWTGGAPARTLTRDDVAAAVFPALRRQAFSAWVNQLVQAMRLDIRLDLPQLEQPEPPEEHGS